MKIGRIIGAIGIALFAASVMAKIPPAPPLDPVAAAAKAEKDKAKAETEKASAEKTKADQARYEGKAVASFQSKMKKTGKPVPKPTPIVVAAASAPTKAPAKPANQAPAKK